MIFKKRVKTVLELEEEQRRKTKKEKEEQKLSSIYDKTYQKEKENIVRIKAKKDANKPSIFQRISNSTPHISKILKKDLRNPRKVRISKSTNKDDWSDNFFR